MIIFTSHVLLLLIGLCSVLYVICVCTPLTVCVYVCGPRKVVLIVSHRRLVHQPGTYLVVWKWSTEINWHFMYRIDVRWYMEFCPTNWFLLTELIEGSWIQSTSHLIDFELTSGPSSRICTSGFSTDFKICCRFKQIWLTHCLRQFLFVILKILLQIQADLIDTLP